MDFRDLVFLTITELGSFTKASKELYISQPAVTKHVKELESKLNCKLFSRSGSKIALTKEGRLVYDHLKKIKRGYRELYDDLNSLNNKSLGEINIGASTTIANYILPRIILDFCKKYPNIHINLITGNSEIITNKLFENDIDIGFVENSSSERGIHYKTFMHDNIIGVCGANTLYGTKKFITKQELLRVPIVIRERGSGTLEVIKKSIEKNLNIKHIIGSTEGIKRLLVDFNGISLISNKAVEVELKLKTLKQVNIKDFSIKRELRIAHREGHITSQVESFIHFCLS